MFNFKYSIYIKYIYLINFLKLFSGILLKNTSIKPINQSMIVPTPYSINNHVYQVI